MEGLANERASLTRENSRFRRSARVSLRDLKERTAVARSRLFQMVIRITIKPFIAYRLGRAGNWTIPSVASLQHHFEFVDLFAYLYLIYILVTGHTLEPSAAIISDYGSWCL